MNSQLGRSLHTGSNFARRIIHIERKPPEVNGVILAAVSFLHSSIEFFRGDKVNVGTRTNPNGVG